MLENALLFDRPFRYFICFDSFDAAMATEMRRVLSSDLAWEVRTGSFYVTRRLDLRQFYAKSGNRPSFLDEDYLIAMRDRMAELFGEPLSDEVQVLGHRMLPGQSIGVHNDNPGLGFENYRIITQLTEDHRIEHGGTLNLYATDRGDDIFQQIRPCYNMSVGFEASDRSYHSVNEVTGPNRDALLFNFWHVGNDPAAERAIYRALGDLWTDEDRSRPDSGMVAAQIADALVQRWRVSPAIAARSALAVLATARAADPAMTHARRNAIARWQAIAATDGTDDATSAAIVALAGWLAGAPRRNFSRIVWRDARDIVEAGRRDLPARAREAADAILPMKEHERFACALSAT